MKNFLFLLYTIICCACFSNGNITGNERDLQFNPRSGEKHEKTPSVTLENGIKVEEYEGNKLTTAYSFDKNNKLRKKQVFDEDEPKNNSTTKYFYSTGGFFDRAEFVENNNVELDKIFNKHLRDFYSDLDYLKSKKIRLRFAELISDNLRGTARMLFIGDKTGAFKKEVLNAGSKKIIRYSEFDMTVRFYPANVGIAADEVIESYELVIDDGYLSQETYETEGSRLKGTGKSKIVTQYFYDHNHNLVKEIGTVSYVQNEQITESINERRFEYHGWDEKLKLPN